MPGPRSSNTYTCTCTHFCGGYKTGLSRATFYRHSPYRVAAQPPPTSFSTSFQNFLDNSAGNSGSGRSCLGREEYQGNTDTSDRDSDLEFPTQALGGTPTRSQGQNFEEAAGVIFPF
jgi:hypothetical protein